MSGILGIVQQDGGPLPQSLLPAMRDAMLVRPPDGVGLWQDGPAGLGSLLRHNTPESVYEQLPLVQPHGDLDSLPSVVSTAAARLDNREELCDLLEPCRGPHGPRPPTADCCCGPTNAGAKSVRRGCWAIGRSRSGIRDQRLFLARDHHGISAVYYWSDRRRFAFASDHLACWRCPTFRTG